MECACYISANHDNTNALCYNSCMPRSLKSRNPFYALLVVMGVTFALTATTYCVMAFREARIPAGAEVAQAATAPHPLITWIHHNGETALLTELALLGIFVVAAIATDNYWQRRTNSSK